MEGEQAATERSPCKCEQLRIDVSGESCKISCDKQFLISKRNPVQALVAASCIKSFLSTWSWSSRSGTDHSTNKQATWSSSSRSGQLQYCYWRFGMKVSPTLPTSIEHIAVPRQLGKQVTEPPMHAGQSIVEAVQNYKNITTQSQDKVPPMMLRPGH